MDLTFFVREGDLYRRSDERHVQYIHGVKELVRAIGQMRIRCVERNGQLQRPTAQRRQPQGYICGGKEIRGAICLIFYKKR